MEQLKQDLQEALEVLKSYPKGQDDGTWIKRRQELLDKYTQQDTQIDDIQYFLKKALDAINCYDFEGAKVCIKRLYLMNDALITYRLHKLAESTNYEEIK
jgi:hypothetical protein